MDMTQSIAPRSDQINADDLMAGPVTVTVKEVTEGAAEQPFDFHLHEYPGRAYRPSKSMRRVIVMAWGKETTEYTGRRLTLFRNPNIKFGKDEVGGIEISHLSHIDKPLTVALTATRGKRKAFTVAVLAAPVARNWLGELEQAGDNLDAIKSIGAAASAAAVDSATIEIIRARYTELRAAQATEEKN